MAENILLKGSWRASVCSCDKCDSFECFALRHQAHQGCNCGKCHDSKSCLYFSKQRPNNKFSKESFLEQVMKETIEINQITSVEAGYKDDSEIKIETENPEIEAKIDIEMKTENEMKTDVITDKLQLQQLKGDTRKKKIDEKEKALLNIEKKIKEIENHLMYEKSAINKVKSESQPKKIEIRGDMAMPSSKYRQKLKQGKERVIHPCLPTESPIAQLSAQVMNVPYIEYEKSVQITHLHGVKEPITKAESIAKSERYKQPGVKETEHDVFQKIRAIYNACSCKVCECIASFSLIDSKNEPCNCKPCECAECRSLKKNKKLREKETLQAPCSCKPCACIKCRMVENTGDSCRCKPCQCIQCKHLNGTNHKYKSYIVASAAEDPPNRLVRQCVCSPCGCFQCASNNLGPRNINSVTRDTGTEAYRHSNCPCNTCNNNDCEQEGADTCNCDRHSKALRKPVLQDNEYDVRNVAITDMDNNNLNQSQKKSMNTDDTLVMTLATPKYYSATDFGWHTSNITPLLSTEACDCEPCECLKCQKHYTEGHTSTNFNDRSCEICTCVNCSNINLAGRTKYDLKSNYQCYSKNVDGTTSPSVENVNVYKLNRHIRENKVNMNSYNEYLQEKEKKCASKIAVATSNKKYKNISDVSRKKETSKKENNETTLEKKFDTFDECMKKFSEDGQIVSKIYNTRITRNKAKEKEYMKQKADVSVVTNYDSTESYVSAGETLAVNIKKKMPSLTTKKFGIKSGSSSCNSSGHDYSDYLIRFPRSTVETCIKDVMNIPDITFSNASYKKSRDDSYSMTSKISGPQLNKTKTPIPPCDINSTLKSIDTGRISYVKMCQKLISNEPCNCTKCVCENQSSDKVEKNRKCTTCVCSETCLKEDQLVIIRKNEAIQTLLLSQEREEDTLGNDHTQLETKTIEIEKNNNLSNTDKLYDDSEFVMNVNNFEINKSIEHSDNKFPMNLQPTSLIYYESVVNTLREAKAFSGELLQILVNYEEANKNFESITEKIKKQQKRSVTNDNGKITNNILDENVKEFVTTEIDGESQHKETNGISDVTNEMKETLTTVKNDQEIKENVPGVFKNNIFPNERVKQDLLLKKYKKYRKVINKAATRYRLYFWKMGIGGTVSKTSSRIAAGNKNSSSRRHHNIKKQVTSPQNLETINKEPIPIMTIKEQSPSPVEELVNHTKSQICLDDIVKRLSSNGDMNTVFMNRADDVVSIDKTKDRNENEDNMSGLGKMLDQSHSMVSTDDLLPESKQKAEDHNTIQVGDMPKDNKAHDDVPRFILEAKEAFLDSGQKIADLEAKEQKSLKSGRDVPYSIKNEIMCSLAESTNKFKALQRKFESVPIMSGKKFYEHSGTTRSTAKYGSYGASTSYEDSDRVCFQTVRKVSNHSLLVKWKAPAVTNDVQGYEILIDGQSVQKVNPSRNVAVVTCLPHSEKVHLTVKTIKSGTKNNSNPSATFIYRPKSNKFRNFSKFV